MEKQFFKQLLEKLDPRFNKDTTSHVSFIMWHELQGWATSVIVKLKCSAVTLYLCHRCDATVKLYWVCDQWQQLTGKSGFCIYLMLRPTSCRHHRGFFCLHRYCSCIFCVYRPPLVCCMWPPLQKSIGRSISWLAGADTCWSAATAFDFVTCIKQLCAWLSVLSLWSSIKSTKCQRHDLHSIQQTDLHTCSELLLCIKLKSLQIWLNRSTLGRFYFLHNRSQPPSELGTSSPSREQSAV